jgi:hypothetical protein
MFYKVQPIEFFYLEVRRTLQRVGRLLGNTVVELPIHDRLHRIV